MCLKNFDLDKYRFHHEEYDLLNCSAWLTMLMYDLIMSSYLWYLIGSSFLLEIKLPCVLYSIRHLWTVVLGDALRSNEWNPRWGNLSPPVDNKKKNCIGHHFLRLLVLRARQCYWRFVASLECKPWWPRACGASRPSGPWTCMAGLISACYPSR